MDGGSPIPTTIPLWAFHATIEIELDGCLFPPSCPDGRSDRSERVSARAGLAQDRFSVPGHAAELVRVQNTKELYMSGLNAIKRQQMELAMETAWSTWAQHDATKLVSSRELHQLKQGPRYL